MSAARPKHITASRSRAVPKVDWDDDDHSGCPLPGFARLVRAASAAAVMGTRCWRGRRAWWAFRFGQTSRLNSRR